MADLQVGEARENGGLALSKHVEKLTLKTGGAACTSFFGLDTAWSLARALQYLAFVRAWSLALQIFW